VRTVQDICNLQVSRVNLKTENIENNHLTKFEIGKAILPTPMKFSPDHVPTQTVANQSTPTFQ
jgi:hypothetical protein